MVLATPCIAVETTRELFDVLVSFGVDKKYLIQALGSRAKQLSGSETRFPVTSHLDLWRVGESLLGYNSLGLHIGSSSNPAMRGIVGLVFAASPNLAAAVENKIHYTHILADHIAMELTHNIDSFSVEYSILGGYFHRYEVERVFAGFLNWVRMFVEEPVMPVSVQFQYAKPDCCKIYNQEFGDNILFDQQSNVITFNAKLLTHPNIKFNEYLYGILCERAGKVLQQLGSDTDFLASVRSTIAGRLSHGNFSAVDIAKFYNMSVRTLHRKLKVHQHSYQAILDNVRKEMAISYLEAGSCNPQSVSYLVGYADERAFHRAFKRWTGVSPKQYLSVNV